MSDLEKRVEALCAEWEEPGNTSGIEGLLVAHRKVCARELRAMLASREEPGLREKDVLRVLSDAEVDFYLNEIPWREDASPVLKNGLRGHLLHFAQTIRERVSALAARPVEAKAEAGERTLQERLAPIFPGFTSLEQRLFYEHVQRFLLGEETRPAPADTDLARLEGFDDGYTEGMADEGVRNAKRESARPAPADALRKALVKIASGMGRDIEGTTSLSREDMQDIAQTALREGAKEARDE